MNGVMKNAARDAAQLEEWTLMGITHFVECWPGTSCFAPFVSGSVATESRLLLLLLKVGGEADAAALGRRRVHQLADGGEDGGDRLIVGGEPLLEPCFELIEASRQLPVRGEHLTQPHEGAHHVDAHLDGARAVEDRGGHDGSVLGEGVRQVLAVLPPAGL